MTKRLNVLLTGASGGVGIEAVKQLVALKDKYSTTVFDLKTKNSQRLLKPYKKDVNIVYGDISNQKDVDSISHNVDVVIHLAALIPPVADEKPELAEKINVGGTTNLIRSLEKNSPNAFFMYSSSVSIYGDRIQNPEILVGDKINPSVGDEYALTKIATEKIIQESSLAWTIFRLSAIMGKHKISKLMFHMPLDTPMEITTTEDTARAFVNGIPVRKQLQGQIFNLGGGPECRIIYRDFLQRSFEVNGLGKMRFPRGTFATHNFHCGYYADGDNLAAIVDFRRDSIDDFFNKMKKDTSSLQIFFASIFRKSIKKSLLKQSEPYHALKKDDTALVERFFGKEGKAVEMG